MGRKLHVYVQPYGKHDVVLEDAIRKKVRACFPPGFGLEFHDVSDPVVKGNLSGIVTTSDLQDMMGWLAGFEEEEEPEEPWLHLACARWRSGKSLQYGVAYDSDEADEFQRRGCMVFRDAITEEDGDPDFLARTVAHELGHVLNLGHEDAESTSLMQPGNPLPRQLEFSRISARHLLKHPLEHVMPGRLPFGRLHPDGSRSHPSRGVTGDEAESRGKLRISIQFRKGSQGYAAAGAKISLGEPLFVRTVLENRGSRRSGGLRPSSSGGVQSIIQVRGPVSGAWRSLTPRMDGCGGASVALDSKAGIAVDEAILSRRGYPFPRPGTYELRAVAMRRGRPLVSKVRRLRVVAEPSRARQRRLDALLQPEVCRAFECGVDPTDLSAVRRFKQAYEGFPKRSGVRNWGQLVLARAQAREALDHEVSRYKQRRTVKALIEVHDKRSAPPAIRQEAALWAARVLARYDRHDDARGLLERLIRFEGGDVRFRDRALRERERLDQGGPL